MEIKPAGIYRRCVLTPSKKKRFGGACSAALAQFSSPANMRAVLFNPLRSPETWRTSLWSTASIIVFQLNYEAQSAHATTCWQVGDDNYLCMLGKLMKSTTNFNRSLSTQLQHQPHQKYICSDRMG